ncbi:hypothetical protein AB0P40_43940 [Streptomyces sp. NPDC079189]|uniref:hypothetical protein n=1 Tax=Streptomyces sp. NPDC079189 TaxID=3154514 RepID=UPI0034497248
MLREILAFDDGGTLRLSRATGRRTTPYDSPGPSPYTAPPLAPADALTTVMYDVY